MNSLRFILFFFCSLQALQVQSQDIPALHYTMNDGLPSNTVYYVYRDSKGFLWLATDKGVARYNGVHFETFTTFNGLADNEVFFFKEDPYGRLWMATYNGELCFFKDDSFHTEANTPYLRRPFKNSYIRQISVEKDSSVTFSFDDNYKFINLVNNRLDVYDLNKIDSSALLWSIISRKKTGPRQFSLFFTNYIIDLDSTLHQKAVRTSSYNSLYGKELHFWNKSFSQDQLYHFNEGQILNEKPEAIITLSAEFRKNNYTRQVYFDGKNYLVIANNGLFINAQQHIFHETTLSSITQDNYGNYWLTSNGHGVYKINAAYSGTKAWLIKDTVTYAWQDNGHHYFVTANNTLKDFYKWSFRTVLTEEKYILKQVYSKVGSYLVDSNKFYYLNNFVASIATNISSKPLVKTHFVGKNESLTFGKAIKRNNSIFINGKSQIIRLNFDRPVGYELYVKASQRIFDMMLDNRGELWYATISNVYRIQNDTPRLVQGLETCSFRVFNLYGKYIVGYTHKNQLVVGYQNGDSIQLDSVTSQDCIWYRFYAIDSAHILISTNNLYRLLTLDHSTGRNSFSIRPVENPFMPQQADAITVDSNNCYFFKAGNMTEIALANIYAIPPSPSLFFVSMRTLANTYTTNRPNEIVYGDAKNIKLTFRTVSAEPNVEYQYSISVNELDNWIDIASPEINLVNPRYGIYNVKIRAKTLSSSYSAPLLFVLNILPPLWARSWFIILTSLAVLAIATLVIRYRIVVSSRKKERRHEERMKNLKLEYTALNALMNPHFIFNTLNNVQSLFNQNKRLAANEYLRIFADLIRQNMENISLDFISLEKEITLVSNYLMLEKLRFDERLEYKINIDDDLDLSAIMVPPLFIQPLVENSIKHGILPSETEAGIIQVNVFCRLQVLCIEIMDNGIGFAKAAEMSTSLQHHSFGLENIKRRIGQLAIMQGRQMTFELTETSNPDGSRWTTATITIPIPEVQQKS